MSRLLILATAAMLLTGCNEQKTADTQPAQTIKPPVNAFAERLRALDEEQRNGTLRKAILDSDERCGVVEKSAYQTTYKGLEMWTATCVTTKQATGDGRFALFIGIDGSVQARKCEQTAQLGLPECKI